MKTPVKHLTGDLLNYAVALAENYEPRYTWMLAQRGYTAWQAAEHAHGNPVPDYATTSDGDRIIDRECISTQYSCGEWYAFVCPADEHADNFEMEGATRREAAMRCYVASKFGNEIELPRMNCTPPNEQTA